MRFIAIFLLFACFLAMHVLAADSATTPDMESGVKLEEELSGLVRKLCSQDFEARQAAARALEQLGERAVPRLERCLENASDPEIHAQVSSILGRIAAAPVTDEQTGQWMKDLFDLKCASRTYAARRLLIHKKGQAIVECARSAPEKELPALVQLLLSPPIWSLKSAEGDAPALATLNGLVQNAGYRLSAKKMTQETAEIAVALLEKVLARKQSADATELALILGQMHVPVHLEEADSAPMAKKIMEALTSAEASVRYSAVLSSSAAAHLLHPRDAAALCEKLAALFSDPDPAVAASVSDHFAGKLGNQFSAQYSLGDRASSEAKKKIAAGLLQALKESGSNSYDDLYRLTALVQISGPLQASQRDEAIAVARKMVARERAGLDAAQKAGASVMLNRLQSLRELLKELEEQAK